VLKVALVNREINSMEEAEHLCDRLSIFAAGELQTVGTSHQMKQRFGNGYKLSVTSDSSADTMRKFVANIAPSAEPLNNTGVQCTFEIPTASVRLSSLFKEMEANKERLAITDWAISNTSTIFPLSLPHHILAFLSVTYLVYSIGGSIHQNHT
jgi:ABC-type multidrug transport system ATPase subunit